MRVPQTQADRVESLLQNALRTSFGLTSRREKRDCDAYLLKVKEPGHKRLAGTAYLEHLSESTIRALFATMFRMALSRPILGNSEANRDLLARICATRQVSFNAGWHHLTFKALGSPCRVQLVAPKQIATVLLEEIVRWVAEFEEKYSRFISTSLVSRINAAAGKDWVDIDPQTERLLALCHEMHFITRGVFDPTALPLIRLWDWQAKTPVVPDDDAIQAALKKVGWRKVQRAPGKVFLPEPGMALDLGGVGKEYAVDQVTQIAIESGATGVLVDFGHDVRVYGPAPDNKPAWHIGLEDPLQPGKCWTGLAVQNQAVATSGDYLRNFVHGGTRYGHIIDVRTGRPVTNGCRAVSVLASNCTLAGMLATTALVLGPQEGLKLLDVTYQAEGCIIEETTKFTSRRFHEYATGLNR